jgi:acetyl-CoA C-acetyltransferase
VYASAPPPPTRNAERETASSPPREAEAPLPLAIDPEGGGEIEAYTVLYERDGTPRNGIVVGRLDDGRRFLAQTPEDARLLEDLVREEAIGRRGRVAPETVMNRFHPQ